MSSLPPDPDLKNAVGALGRLFDGVDHAITIADPDLDDIPLIYVNPAFCELTGYARTDLIGRNCRFLQGPETDMAYVKTVGDHIREQRTSIGLLRNYRSDGEAFMNILCFGPVHLNGPRRFFVGCQNAAILPQESINIQGDLVEVKKQFPEGESAYNKYLWSAIESFRMRFEAVSQRIFIDKTLRAYLSGN